MHCIHRDGDGDGDRDEGGMLEGEGNRKRGSIALSSLGTIRGTGRLSKKVTPNDCRAKLDRGGLSVVYQSIAQSVPSRTLSGEWRFSLHADEEERTRRSLRRHLVEDFFFFFRWFHPSFEYGEYDRRCRLFQSSSWLESLRHLSCSPWSPSLSPSLLRSPLRMIANSSRQREGEER